MKVSVVCPYYNEEAIIKNTVERLVDSLRSLACDWELILVNDGSTDDSLSIVAASAKDNPRIRMVNLPFNEGRGYALKCGINEARGDVIVTTEIDLSWGADIVHRIVKKFDAEPYLDVVIASPHLTGGGYCNVPRYRVMVSRLGNWIIRAFFTKKITMNTGMTRGYRRSVIQELVTIEKGKEFHLEVLLKLLYLDYRMAEIPAVLEWKDKEFKKAGAPQRRSSSKTSKLVISHLNYVVFANPIRYFWAISFGFGLSGAGASIYTGYLFWRGRPWIYSASITILLLTVALLFFGFGIVSHQNSSILRELWRIQKMEKEKNRQG